MKRIIYTNLPDDKPEFAIMQKCFDGMNLPFELLNCDNAGVTMEKYVNSNNVFFQCHNERDQKQVAIERACSSLHRIIINFDLINTSGVIHD